jgi:hypothetical protein
MPAMRSSTLFANPTKGEWPERFHRAPAEVQEAYRFALAYPEVLQYMPCYCGCIDDGHQSNKDCFIIEARADGSFMLEPMSFG